MAKLNLSKTLHRLSFYPKERVEIFLDLPQEKRAYVLQHLTEHVLQDILKRLPDEEVVNLLENLDPDEATDLAQKVTPKRRKKILDLLTEEVRNGIQLLSQFDPNTAAGLMHLNYIQVDYDDKVSDVARQFRTHEKRTGRLPAIVVMKEGRVSGYLPGHQLGFARPSEKITRYVKRLRTIRHSAQEEEVLQVFYDHPHNKIAVLGEEGNVLGIIYSDDVLRILNERESSSLYDFAGVHEEEAVSDSIGRKVRNRYKWLILNLGTAFLAAFVVSLFESTISRFVLLAVYMPIVAGMGGNAGTQTLAVLVRGISLKQIDLSTAMRALTREVGAGLINGVLNGLLVAGVVLVFNRDVRLAAVLAMAMVFNLLVASFFGTMVPLIMKRLGKDPATSATIFITTATDVLGFMAFLGLATLILR